MARTYGHESSVVLQYETTYGEEPASAAGIKLPVKSFSLQGSEELNQPDLVGTGRQPQEPYEGNLSVSGSGAVVPVDYAAIGYWLKLLLGAPATTGAGPYEHAFTIPTSLTSALAEKVLGGTAKARYSGVAAGSMSMSVAPGELTATFGLVARNEEIPGAAWDASPTAVTVSRALFKHASIKEGGSALATGTEFSLNLDMGLDSDDYAIGDGGLISEPGLGVAGVSGSLKTLFSSGTLLGKSVDGTETSLELTLSSGSLSLVIGLPAVRFKRRVPDIDGPQGIYLDLEWTAYQPDGGEVVTFTLTNEETGY